MKISISTFATGLTLIVAAAADEFQCNGMWMERGLTRKSIIFKGYCENRWGQCFLDNLNGQGLATSNWQAWRRDDGWWQADFSMPGGSAKEANIAMTRATGLYRWCWDW